MTTLDNYDTIASKFNNNISLMAKGLSSIENQANKLLDTIHKKKYEPNIFEKIFPSIAKKQIEKQSEQYKNELLKWESLTGAEYPFVLNDAGSKVEYTQMEHDMKPYLSTRDGYYHIPDELCVGDFSKGIRKDMEDKFKSDHTGIPMSIGLKLEEIFKQPGTTWIHRTQIGFDDTNLLNDIAKNGLICTANDLENTATPFKNYTIFVSQVVSAYQYRQNSCLGSVIIKTDGEPKIMDQRLDANQIVGYIGSDFGKLHNFISKEEMEQMQPEHSSYSIDELNETTVDRDPVTELIEAAKEEIEKPHEPGIPKQEFSR